MKNSHEPYVVIASGDGIYKLMLAALTSNDALVAELLKKSTNL